MNKLLKATIYKKVPNSQSEVELLEASGPGVPAIILNESSSESTLCGYVNSFLKRSEIINLSPNIMEIRSFEKVLF